MKRLFLLILALAVTTASTLSAPVKSRLAFTATDYLSHKTEMIPVAYIESTGTQCILTPFAISNDMETEVCAASTADQTDETIIAGARDRATNVRNYIICTGGNLQLSAQGTSLSIPFDNYFHTFFHSKTMLRIDDLEKSRTGNNDTSSVCFALFAYNYNNSITLYSRCRIQYAKFGNYGFLHAIRFLNEFGQWEGAMFDTVSGSLYRNSGTGSFIIGPDL